MYRKKNCRTCRRPLKGHGAPWGVNFTPMASTSGEILSTTSSLPHTATISLASTAQTPATLPSVFSPVSSAVASVTLATADWSTLQQAYSTTANNLPAAVQQAPPMIAGHLAQAIPGFTAQQHLVAGHPQMATPVPAAPASTQHNLLDDSWSSRTGES